MNEHKGRIDIKGISKENMELLTRIKKEYGFTSMNQLFIFFIDSICEKEKLDILDTQYSSQQQHINKNIEILSYNFEKLVHAFELDQIEKLKLYEETLSIKLYLENLNNILFEDEL